MNDKIKVLITCRFPEWEQLGNKYPAFGVKYVIEVPIDCEDVLPLLKEKYKNSIHQEFKGEILFVEALDATFLI